jgi:hypothetical protein
VPGLRVGPGQDQGPGPLAGHRESVCRFGPDRSRYCPFWSHEIHDGASFSIYKNNNQPNFPESCFFIELLSITFSSESSAMMSGQDLMETQTSVNVAC